MSLERSISLYLVFLCDFSTKVLLVLYLLSDVREWEEFQSVCSHPEEGWGDWEGLTSTAARQINWRLYHTTTVVSPAVSTSLIVHATHTHTHTHTNTLIFSHIVGNVGEKSLFNAKFARQNFHSNYYIIVPTNRLRKTFCYSMCMHFLNA